jgi:putative FmdB family regulatory protein
VPLYEYQCPRCGRFEVIQKFSDSPLRTCPTCGQEVHKLLSAPAIQFKGTGWYITDYARKGTANAEGGTKSDGGAAKSDGAAKPGSDKASTSDSSSESKSGTSKDSTATGGSTSTK